jgi:hypothetical protein
MKKRITIFLIILIIGVLASCFLLKKIEESNNYINETNLSISIEDSINYKDLVILNSPLKEERISSPLIIRGKARGTWFFEASFPVILTDWDGLIIAEGFATAKENWMTEDFVEFEGYLNFEKPSYGKRGSLILKKDNPSGLPEHDDALEITIFFE